MKPGNNAMKPRVFYFIGLLLPALLLLALPALAQPHAARNEGAYDLSWSVIGGGGAVSSTSGSYALSGTIGQSAVGTNSSGNCNLNAGFWFSGMNESRVYLPLVLR